jgi:hypothetical protein
MHRDNNTSLLVSVHSSEAGKFQKMIFHQASARCGRQQTEVRDAKIGRDSNPPTRLPHSIRILRYSVHIMIDDLIARAPEQAGAHRRHPDE